MHRRNFNAINFKERLFKPWCIINFFTIPICSLVISFGTTNYRCCWDHCCLFRTFISTITKFSFNATCFGSSFLCIIPLCTLFSFHTHWIIRSKGSINTNWPSRTLDSRISLITHLFWLCFGFFFYNRIHTLNDFYHWIC